MSWSSPGVEEAFLLSWISLVVTVIAFIVGLIVAVATASSATLGFALENAVDFMSSALVCWRFQGGGKTVKVETLEQREKRASVGIALSFVVLAFVVGGVASGHLGTHEAPSHVGALLGLAVPALLLFGGLGALKLWVGIATDSPSMKKDAACSLCGACLSLGVCIGVALSEGSDIWWFDAVVALVVSVLLLIYGVFSLAKNAEAGIKWWTLEFWGSPTPRKRADRIKVRELGVSVLGDPTHPNQDSGKALESVTTPSAASGAGPSAIVVVAEDSV